MARQRYATDMTMLHVLPERKHYRTYKQERTPDFSDLRNKIAEVEGEKKKLREGQWASAFSLPSPSDGLAAEFLTCCLDHSACKLMQRRSTRSSARSALAPVERSNASVESTTPRLKKTKSAATPGSRGKSGAAPCKQQGPAAWR